MAIDTRNSSALRLHIDVVGVGWIGEHEETVTSVEIFPAAVGDASGISGVSHPDAVVLQAAVNVIRIGGVYADVIELTYR